jgi:hypothetical protein
VTLLCKAHTPLAYVMEQHVQNKWLAAAAAADTEEHKNRDCL